VSSRGINFIMPTLLGEAILPRAKSAIRPPRWTLGLSAAGGAPVIAALSGPPTAEAQVLNLQLAIGDIEVRVQQAQAADEQRIAAELQEASSPEGRGRKRFARQRDDDRLLDTPTPDRRRHVSGS
jgi:hypothetical protein